MKAVPALLNKTADEMKSQYVNLYKYFTDFQIDICDGILVPNTTVSLEDVIDEINKWPNEILAGKKFDFDLMVVDFNNAIEHLNTITNKITINNVFLHSRSIKNQSLPKSKTFTIGIAIDPEDSLEDLESQLNIKDVKSIQIMTVNPGFQGSPFLSNQLLKIEQLRKIGYESLIYIDGSVNETTIPQLIKLDYKPDVIGIGSFFSKAPDINIRLEFLKSHNIST